MIIRTLIALAVASTLVACGKKSKPNNGSSSAYQDDFDHLYVADAGPSAVTVNLRDVDNGKWNLVEEKGNHRRFERPLTERPLMDVKTAMASAQTGEDSRQVDIEVEVKIASSGTVVAFGARLEHAEARGRMGAVERQVGSLNGKPVVLQVECAASYRNLPVPTQGLTQWEIQRLRSIIDERKDGVPHSRRNWYCPMVVLNFSWTDETGEAAFSLAYDPSTSEFWEKNTRKWLDGKGRWR